MIKIYGSPRTSAGRCFLMLEELGLPYQTMPLDMMAKQHKSTEYLKLNPNGKVPCLIDGDFVIWESMAINFYLAEKYRPELLGKTSQEKAVSLQWSTWGMVELQPPLVDLIIQLMFTPEDKRDQKVIDRAHEKVPALLAIFDKHISGRDFVAGQNLTVGDFNMASIVNIAQALKFDLKPYANIVPWFDRMKTRPSFKKFAEMRSH